jgi:hypothetical protein
VTVPIDPIAIALAVARVLDALGVVHTIGGSIASSFAGEPRSTVDIDFIAALDESKVRVHSMRNEARPRLSARMLRGQYTHASPLRKTGFRSFEVHVPRREARRGVRFAVSGTPARIRTSDLSPSA